MFLRALSGSLPSLCPSWFTLELRACFIKLGATTGLTQQWAPIFQFQNTVSDNQPEFFLVALLPRAADFAKAVFDEFELFGQPLKHVGVGGVVGGW